MSRFDSVELNIEERVYKRFSKRNGSLPPNRKDLSCDIKILVDTSSSTVNTGSRFRSRFRLDYDELADDHDEPMEDRSDIIIVMEILGVIEVLRRLEEKYVLTGTKCQVITFSTDASEVLLTNINTVDEFASEFIKVISDNYHGGSTNLESALKLAFDEGYKSEQTVLIIATDGHTNEGCPMTDITSNINKGVYFSKETHDKLVSFIVGAGSIRLNESSGRYFRTVRDQGIARFDVDDERYSSWSEMVRYRASGCASECNMEYLLSFMGSLGNAVYCASCKDFSLLNEAVVQFLNEHETLFMTKEVTRKWKVDLGSWMDLAPEHSSILNVEGAAIAYVPAVKSWYCYITNRNTRQGWQVAVKAPQEVDIHKIYIPYQEYRDLNFHEARLCIGQTPINTTTGETFRVKVDYAYQWRCRRLILA